MIWQQRGGSGRGTDGAVGPRAVPARSAAHLAPPALRLPAGLRITAVVVAGGIAAALVGYLATQSQIAAPVAAAVEVRIAIIATLTLCGACALAGEGSRRMGHLMLGAAVYSSVWLLNGSGRPALFGIGMLAAGAAPTVFAYLVLSQPTGRLRSRAERVLLGGAGSALLAAWVLAVLSTPRIRGRTPLVACQPSCPRNVFYVVGDGSLEGVLRPLIFALWLVIILGTVTLLARRFASASAPLRRSLGPLIPVAAANALTLWWFVAARAAGSHLAPGVGVAYVATAAAVPVAILAGLVMERLYMGRSLVDFVRMLADASAPDVQGLMARALHDPSLRIVYRRPALGTPVFAAGAGAAPGDGRRERASTEITRHGRPIAAVVYNPELAGQEGFIQAAGDAAIQTLQLEQLEAELAASTADLAASRRRLVDVADAERQRIQRDLHDGAQQHLLAMRMKLDRAVEAMGADSRRGQLLLAEIGEDMEEALRDVRSLGAGVYPPALAAYGLDQALRSAARQSPLPVAVRTEGVGRYAPDVEAAVYFASLEALQNIAKHAGADAGASLELCQRDGELSLLIADSGDGFDPSVAQSSMGLLNMRDRLRAVGGELEVSSAPGRGTLVLGRVPACPR